MGFFDEDISDFTGLPIVSFPETVGGEIDERAAADPGAYAWRLRAAGEYEDDGPTDYVDVFADFLARVDTSAVQAVVIASWGQSYETSSVEAVGLLAGAADRLPALRTIFLGDIAQDEAEISWITQSDVSPLLKAYPQLERLWIRGSQGLEIEILEHHGLAALVVECGGLPGEFARHVDASELPNLEYLELYLGVDEYGGDVTATDLTEILAGAKFPKLTYLGLRDAINANEMAEALADAPVVAQLEVLDLSLGALTDAGADALLNGQPLTHLERLDLHHHYLSDAMMDRIEEAFLGTGTEVDVNEQEEPDEFDEDGEPAWLSVAVSE
jgi:hypothetical protein